jgi:peroxiredoxin Q/BCP
MRSLITILLAGAAAQAAGLGDALRPEPGDKAPGFSAPATSGETIDLSRFLGKKSVILAFFPKAFTGG